MAYNQETADRICERLAAGESLRAICQSPDLPAESTIRLWALNDTNGFAAQYARAREIQAHVLAEEIIDISDTTQEGVETTVKADGTTETKHGDMLGHRKLRVDSRKWYLSKVLPKVYGEKLELAGVVNVKTTPADLSDDDLAAIAAGRKLNSLALKVPENTGSDLPAIENCSNGDNNA